MNQQLKRIASLDVLRGLTIMGMIMVNTQGIGPVRFEFLIHSMWDGCSLADMVYPFFIFIVGASIFYAFRRFGGLSKSVTIKILKRSFWIAAIGVVLHNFPFTSAFEDWRLPGVLQRIALVYIICSFIVLSTKSWVKISLFAAGSLLIYAGILHIGSTDPYDNIVRSVDVAIFGESHLYTIYLDPPTIFDPEGLLGSLPALANALLGYLSARAMDSAHKRGSEPWSLALAAGCILLVAYVWAHFLPFNKPLWTPPFALLTSGWAIVVWLVLYYVIDRSQWSFIGAPFKMFGTNALLAYILSELLLMMNYTFPMTIGDEKVCVHQWLDAHCFSILAEGPMRPAFLGILMLGICALVLYPLYRRRIFVKL